MAIVTKVRKDPKVTLPMGLPTEYEYTAAGGQQIIYSYEGTRSDILAKYTSLLQGSDPLSLSVRRIGETPHFKLTATYGALAYDGSPSPLTNPVVNTYELEDNQLQQPLAQSTVLHGKLGSSSVATSIMAIYERFKGQQITYAAASAEVETLLPTEPAKTNGLTFLGELTRGVDSFINFHNVFRRTITVVHPAQLQWAYVGVNQVWTTAQVEAYENLVNADYFILPSKQWLKLPPRVIAATNQRTQVSWEYWGADEWSSLYYAPYV